MRFIDTASLANEICPNWMNKAEEAAAFIESVHDARGDVAEEITARSEIWSELKTQLSALSYEKCWYCESKQIRSDCHVDHYRPKNAVAGVDKSQHRGYWWLAFDWTNYRFCCTFCNSRRTDRKRNHVGGKGAQFPLKDERFRCYSKNDILNDEVPMLLDPTTALDPPLLTFDLNGAVRPAVSSEKSKLLHGRAHISIDVYHLDQVDLEEARLAICNHVEQTLKRADAAFREMMDGGLTTKERIKAAVDELRKMISAKAEYSSAAKAVIRSYRSEDRPWINVVLELA